jgi:hypothetical protein
MGDFLGDSHEKLRILRRRYLGISQRRVIGSPGGAKRIPGFNLIGFGCGSTQIRILSRNTLRSFRATCEFANRKKEILTVLKLICSLTVAFLCTPPGSAQSIVALAPEVTYVTSVGRWKTETNEGTYRVVVQTGGFEHIVSEAQVDWIADSKNSSDLPKIIVSKIAETGSWRLDHPRFTKVKGRWRIELTAVDSHHSPALRGIWTIDLGKPGVLKTSVTSAQTRK